MPDLMSMTNYLDGITQLLQQVTTVVMSDDDVYIPANLKSTLVLIFGGVGSLLSILFWQLLGSLKERAQRAEKQYDDLLPVLQDSTSTLDKLNSSVSTLMETVRDDLRAARRA